MSLDKITSDKGDDVTLDLSNYKEFYIDNVKELSYALKPALRSWGSTPRPRSFI